MSNTGHIKDPKTAGMAHRIALNFKRLRKTHGWTQSKAAGMLGVNTSYISRIETANAPLGKKAQIKWARIFGVDISEFFKLLPDEEAGLATLDDILAELRAISSRLDRLLDPSRITIPEGNI